MSTELDGGSGTRPPIEATAAEPPSAQSAAALLVGQALDDLAAVRVDVARALELVATMAWQQGHDAAATSPSTTSGPEGPMPSDEGIETGYIVMAVDPATGEIDAQGPFTAVEAMTVADEVRLELDANDLSDFKVTLTPLRRPH